MRRFGDAALDSITLTASTEENAELQFRVCPAVCLSVCLTLIRSRRGHGTLWPFYLYICFGIGPNNLYGISSDRKSQAKTTNRTMKTSLCLNNVQISCNTSLYKVLVMTHEVLCCPYKCVVIINRSITIVQDNDRCIVFVTSLACRNDEHIVKSII